MVIKLIMGVISGWCGLEMVPINFRLPKNHMIATKKIIIQAVRKKLALPLHAPECSSRHFGNWLGAVGKYCLI